MYALIGNDESKNKEASGTFEFRPVGSGLQNFPAILEACKDVNAKWVVVEQDQPSMGKTPLECAETSINYLRLFIKMYIDRPSGAYRTVCCGGAFCQLP